MASTRYAVGSPETVKLWSKASDAVALPKTSLGRISGKGQNNIVCLKDEFKKSRGDSSDYFLRALPSGEGRTEGQTLEGNEEGLTYYKDTLMINQLRHAFRFEVENISDQRTLLETRMDAKNAGVEWSRDRFDDILFNHLCGYTPVESQANPGTHNGHNSVVAYDANHTLRAGGLATDELVGADNTATFDVGLIDQAIERAKTQDIPLRPVNFGGQELYVCFLHPYQVTSLRSSSSTWFSQMQNAMQGGMVNDNPIFTGALGVYNGTVFIENNRVKPGVVAAGTSAVANTRRAVLAGAQTCAMAFGRFGSEDPTRLKWIEETFDYEEEVGMGIKFIMGLKRCVYNGETYGSIVIPTYAAPAS